MEQDDKFRLNKIAARWPAKAVAHPWEQFVFLQHLQQKE